MRLVRSLFLAHLAALGFGLGGLLIALPHPELWSGSALAAEVFTFGIRYAGSLHILLGAAVMLAFGLRALGPRRTLIFFGLSTGLSLGFELLGTGTGWPFGNYAYTGGLGYRVLDRVPYTIPLSWFYMGLASYLLAGGLVRRHLARPRPWMPVALGAYLLTVWDLVLDPAMAHPALPMQFWVWHETGPYFGMPVQNFVGWTVTALAFMALSRVAWRGDVAPDRLPLWAPLGVYLANMGFAMALSLSVGLWLPVAIALALGVVPALAATGRRQRGAVPLPARGDA